jgi:NADH-quinone oxidoreductase subunit C
VHAQVVKIVDGVEQTVEETVEETRKRIEPGYLEVVYHLYSMAKKHGPVVLRMRTVEPDRPGRPAFASRPSGGRRSFRSARSSTSMESSSRASRPAALLMWDGFKDHPMRKDYVEPDDFEYEPTAHDEVLNGAGAGAQGRASAGTPEVAGQ